MLIKYALGLVVFGLLACAPKTFHGEEMERLLGDVVQNCEAAQEEVSQLSVILENLSVKPQDSFLISEYERRFQIYHQKKQQCQQSILGRDSALVQLIRDWQESRQDMRELTERERMIQERILFQKHKPKDSLNLME